MPEYNVEYDQLTCLLSVNVIADNKEDAEKEAFKHLMKYDRDAVDFVTINEVVDEDGTIDETERVMVVKRD